MNVVLQSVDQISKETVDLKKQLATSHQKSDNCDLKEQIRRVHSECGNWKTDSIKEYTKGMKFFEQAFKSLENKLPRKFEEVIDTKMKHYVNNMMQTTMESLMNKQSQNLTKLFEEKLTQ